MSFYIKRQFSEERPKDNQPIFCVIGGNMAFLEYQSGEYPLYDPIEGDTVHYMPHDYWLKEIEDEKKTTS